MSVDEGVLSENQEPQKGLPPVAPPSGRFIAQLFLVPGLIVGVAVLILLGFTWLVGGDSDPQTLLDRMENSNADVRWRAANEFMQRLKKDPQLASDPRLALRLTKLLRKALAELDRTEKALAGSAEVAPDRKTLQEKRKDVEFLSPCLGHMIIPTGAPILCEMARKTAGHDAKTIASLRRKAVWSLANLGENLKRYDRLSSEESNKVLEALEQTLAEQQGEQLQWARLTLQYLQGERKNLGVFQALADCAKADDPFLRELAAMAFSFWDGDAEDNALAEKTLLALARDDGHGVRIEIGEND
ncbi:MAG TPA: hypothetical protein VGY77_02810 [Gemmataceae bacterium]|jgi:hypothetical protein|nr:hypothetical protein [Gemmataceae bacterium]